VESREHLELKQAAAGWLRGEGYVAVADEVRLPAGGFRVDVAGWSDRRPDQWGGMHRCQPRTCLIECKASRSDFARDGGHAAALLGRRRRLVEMLADLGCPPGPALRRAVSVEPTLFDVRACHLGERAGRVRRMRLELLAIDQRLDGAHKFAKMVWWGLADELWLAAAEGLIRQRDLPRGWGLLERDRAGQLRVGLQPVRLQPSERDRQRVLRGIAVAGSRQWSGSTQLPLRPAGSR
jgi:hypothetical protein